MKQRHIALIVEDDKEMAEELSEILRSIDCASLIVDNSEAAMSALQKSPFCLILLDLHIKSEADSIKGHVEHGKGLLRKIRERHGDHYGTAYWLPVVIVSGFAREFDDAVEVMRDGGSDVIRKPFDSRDVSERIRKTLQASGRETHERCLEAPKHSPSLKEGIVIAIPGDRIGRRTRVTVASQSLELPDALLKILLHLMVGRQKGKRVHKRDMGATDEQGFKGISNLRNELKAVLGRVDVIANDYHGNYSFKDTVRIGECDVEKLLEIHDKEISSLAEQLQN